MSRRPNNALSATRVRTAKKPGRYADGNGLYLLIDQRGNKRWIQRLTIRGSRTDLGLGSYPLVSLVEARERAFATLKLALEGGDPRAEKRREVMPTFAEAAQKVIEFNRPTWRNIKHARQWESTLKTYAFPYFGNTPVDQVSGADVMKALTPIWTIKPETARRVRQRISAVMKWAIANEYRYDNPAGEAIEAALPKVLRVKAHMRSLHYSLVPDALRTLRNSKASLASKLSLEYQILTATRPGETRHARWSEINMETRTWTIPSERMKAEREHRVPLSARAIEVLIEAQAIASDSVWVFPSKSGKPLSDMTHLNLLKRLKIDCVPHGFRSSFRDWAAECTDAPWAVMEAALSHVVGNSTEAAYFRSDLFERRRELMEQWAEYLAGLVTARLASSVF